MYRDFIRNLKKRFAKEKKIFEIKKYILSLDGFCVSPVLMFYDNNKVFFYHI